jgi:RNA polymerase sigma factor (sigma-70 family)
MSDAPSPDPLRARFEGLVRDYGRLVRRVVGRTAGVHATALGDDVEQEVLLALWKQVRAGRDIESPAAYLHQAATRETIRMVRKLRATRHHDIDAVDLVDARVPDVEATLDTRAFETRVRAALAGLPEARRAAVEAHLGGLTFDEIMSLTGWSYQRTRNLVSRGMADLRRELTEPAR